MYYKIVVHEGNDYHSVIAAWGSVRYALGYHLGHATSMLPSTVGLMAFADEDNAKDFLSHFVPAYRMVCLMGTGEPCEKGSGIVASVRSSPGLETIDAWIDAFYRDRHGDRILPVLSGTVFLKSFTPLEELSL